MRVMLTVKLPVESFNTAVRLGNAGKIISKIMDKMKPESAYFTEINGSRGGYFVINVDNPSQIPVYAEPWFLNFNAECHFQIVMTPEDLKNSGIDDIGKKWG
ncbi:MAG: panthothenate synthetase [Candidatus Riflebacteria bacterium]|nr:panthothenate synthetase [Candidatus Riflebacteria bacterium]